MSEITFSPKAAAGFEEMVLDTGEGRPSVAHFECFVEEIKRHDAWHHVMDDQKQKNQCLVVPHLIDLL